MPAIPKHLLMLLKNISTPAAVISKPAVIEWYNTPFVSLIKEETKGGTPISLDLLPGSALKWKEIFLNALNGISSEGVQGRYNWSINPITYKDSTYGILTFFQDDKTDNTLLFNPDVLNQFLDLSSSIILVLDKQANILAINTAGASIIGEKRELLTGKNWIETAIPKPDQSRTSRIFKSILDGDINSFRKVEARIRTIHGARHIINWNNDVVKDENGDIFCVLCSGEDITDKRRSESELQISKDKYTKLSENLNDIFFTVDNNYKILFWNSHAQQQTGMASAEVSGKDLFSAVPFIGENDLRQELDSVMSSQNAVQVQKKFTIHGKTRLFQLTLFPLKKGAAVLAADISDQVEYQQRLFEQSQILDQLQEAIVTTDKDGIIENVNRKTLAVTGKHISEIKGKHLSELFKEGDRSRLNTTLTHITPDIPYASEEYIIPAAGETFFHALVHISVRQNISNEPDGFIVSVINIAEAATIRDEIIKINEQLEEKVKQRTHQLEVEKQRAEAANRAKSSFLANMSHEVRTPMNAILGLIHLLNKTELSRMQKQYCNKMSKASQNMLNIINDILDYSKIESGNFELHPVRFSIETILISLRQKLLTRIEDKVLIPSFMVEDSVPGEIIADSVRLEHAISFLLDNAVKFTDSGAVSLRLALEKDTYNTSSLVITVQDTGIGIDKKDLKRMFHPFTQIDDTRSRRYNGAGLGLALCRQLITLMEGYISVTSEPGMGSSFVIHVPVRIPADLKPLKKDVEQTSVCLIEPDDWSADSIQALLARNRIFVNRIDEPEKALQSCGEGTSSVLMISATAAAKLAGNSAFKQLQKEDKIIILMDFPNQLIPDALHGIKTIQKPLLDSHVRLGLSSTRVIEKKQKNFSEHLHNIRILLVEDNIINREVALELLQLEGAQVECAGNGKEALNFLENESYDVILMDIKMPVMDGLEAAAKIKADPYKRLTPIIALSAKSDEREKEKFTENNFVDVISKPFDIKNLIYKIRLWAHKNSSEPLEMENIMQKIKPIEGINIREPISRQNISVEEYYVQLKDFYTAHTDTLETIKAVYNAKDNIKLKKMVEELQESSQQVGAYALTDVCNSLLPHIKKECIDRDCQFIFADLCFQLDKISKDLERFYSSHDETGKSAESSEASAEKYRELLSSLHYYLKESDTKVLEIAENLLLATSSEKTHTILVSIKNYCQRFDFEQALDYFEENRETLEGIND